MFTKLLKLTKPLLAGRTAASSLQVPTTPGSSSGELNLQQLPILSSEALLARLGIDPALNDWRTLAGLDDSIFGDLIQGPFYRYAASVQLAPASESDHHAGPGGLLAHTYDVITLGLKKRRGLQLPHGGSVELINAQRHLWTYAVFAGGLLHDAGKLMGSIRLVVQLHNGNDYIWTPQDKPLHQIPSAVDYRIEFVKAPYSYHSQVALTLFDFLPGTARAWLAREPHIMMQLCAYLRGDRFESGAIGDILEFADQTSTAAAQMRPAQQRFSNKPSTIERFIHLLRNWLAEDEIKLNKNGGMGWVDTEGHVYIVCRALADKFIRHFDDMAIPDLPRDPIRIYDILQDYGFALPTPEGKAIWKVEIRCEEYTHAFTCLKFELRRLSVPTRVTGPFQGDITVHEAGAIKTPKLQKPADSKSAWEIAAKTLADEIRAEKSVQETTEDAQESASMADKKFSEDAELAPHKAADSAEAEDSSISGKSAENEGPQETAAESEKNCQKAEENPALNLLKAAAAKFNKPAEFNQGLEAAQEAVGEKAPGRAQAPQKTQTPQKPEDAATQEAAEKNQAAADLLEAENKYPLEIVEKTSAQPAQQAIRQEAETSHIEAEKISQEAGQVKDAAEIVFKDTIDTALDEPAYKNQAVGGAEQFNQDTAKKLTPQDADQEDAADSEDGEKKLEAAKKYSRYTISGVPLPDKLTFEDEQLPRYFLRWVRENILHKTIKTNDVDALVHFIEDGVFLIAPAIFKVFLELHGMAPELHQKLSKRFVRVRVNIKDPKDGLNIRNYYAVGRHKATRLSGWVIHYKHIFDDLAELPEPNRFIKKTPDL